jgi:hypothetical protein
MERHVEALSQLWLTASSYFYFVLFYILSSFSFFLGRETRIPVEQPFIGCSVAVSRLISVYTGLSSITQNYSIYQSNTIHRVS